MEDLPDGIRRDLNLEYGVESVGELAALQAHYPELELEEVDGEVVQLIYEIEGPTRPGEVNTENARASHVEAKVGDELLFAVEAKVSYGQLPLAGALVDCMEFRRARLRSEAEAFVDLLRTAKPRGHDPDPTVS